jgi:hypothetical protein
MRKSIHPIAVGLALAVAACEGRVVELGGHEPAGASDGGPPAATMETLSSAKLCTIPAPMDAGGSSASDDAGTNLGTIVGTWTGYVEGYSFPQSGSDAVAIAFGVRPDGTIAGTVTFGNEPAPSPPTSGDEPFPPGPINAYPDVPFPYEGFPYTATQLSFDGTRLRLGVVQRELWKTWCGFQKSYDWARGMCGCLPNWPSMGPTDPNASGCELTDPDTGAQVPFSCALAGPCSLYPVCYCTVGSCTVDMTYADASIDVRLASGQFSGSLTGLRMSPLNVYLVKSP